MNIMGSNRRTVHRSSVLSDVALNVVGVLSLLLLPLLSRIDEKGRELADLQDALTGRDQTIAEQGEQISEHAKTIGQKNAVIDGMKFGMSSATKRAERYKDQAERYKVQLDDAKQLVDDYKDQLDNAKKNPAPPPPTPAPSPPPAPQREVKSLDVVFVFDCSASRQNQIQTGTRSILMAGALFPRVTDISVGVLAFDTNSTAKYPLQPLRVRSADNGASSGSLARFLQSIRTEDGLVDVAQACERGMAMLDASTAKGERQVLVLYSDVAPGDVTGVDRAGMARLTSRLQQFCRTGDRRFLALFEFDQSNAIHPYVPLDHRKAYLQMVAACGKRGFFEDTPGMSFPMLFETIFSDLTN